MPRAEALLNNQEVMESYFPSGSSFSSFDFDTCDTPNCFELASQGKVLVNSIACSCFHFRMIQNLTDFLNFCWHEHKTFV